MPVLFIFANEGVMRVSEGILSFPFLSDSVMHGGEDDDKMTTGEKGEKKKRRRTCGAKSTKFHTHSHIHTREALD